MGSFSADLEKALTGLVGRTVPRPVGTLAGHAAGLPFERLIDRILRDQLPGQTFRHYELLNQIYEHNPGAMTVDDRYSLLGPPSLQYLLKRGKSATQKWSIETPFEEKQNDTAEIVVLPSKRLAIEIDKRSPVTLIDVKTQDDAKKAQAPNIISAEKIAHVCKLAIESEKFLPFEILYVGVKWKATKDTLVCTDVRVVSLTDIKPSNLYINWAAALQIQFHPFEVSCDYEGDGMAWAYDYLVNFCSQLERRISNEVEKLKAFRSIL
jgi:hypothetical protein